MGLGKIIPGVSGSMIAITLGIYEDILEAVTNFFNDVKKNTIILGNFGIGVFLSIVIFSKILSFLLDTYYNPVMYLFLGLIIGTLIPFAKKLQINKKNSLLFVIALVIFIFISFKKEINTFFFEENIVNYLYILFLGFIDAITSIVPGISGTAIFMLLGVYKFVLKILGDPFSLEFIIYGIGLIIGIIITCYTMHYLLKSKKEETYSVIFALMVGSISILSLNLFKNFQMILIFPFLIGIVLGNKFDK